MTARRIALIVGLVGSSLWVRPVPADSGRDLVADSLVAALNEARSARGVPRVVRNPLLDKVAERRAAETARLPERRRFDEKAPIEKLIRDAGRRGFASAMQYLAYQGGYDDEAAAAVSTWKAYKPGWAEALRAAWSEVGAATAPAADGTLIVAVVLLEPARRLPAVATIEANVVEAVNRQRQSRGLAPLAVDARLHPVARGHSEDMVRRNYFDHVSPEGIRPADRVSGAGIAYRKVAENLHSNRGADDPVAAAVAGWMKSPGHRANIIDPSFTHTSVGVAVDPEEGDIVMTQLFLRPPDAGASPDTGGPPKRHR